MQPIKVIWDRHMENMCGKPKTALAIPMKHGVFFTPFGESRLMEAGNMYGIDYPA